MDKDFDNEEMSKPQVNEDFSNVIIVDNIPVIGMSRYERLCNVIRKIFGNFGTIIPEGLYLPCTEDGKTTTGFAFIEYETPEMAAHAAVQGNNKKLDNRHKMRVNIFTDFDKFAEMTEEYVLPEKEDYQSKTNLKSWLFDEDGRDQFVIRHSTETQVFWNDPFKKPQNDSRELQYGGEREKKQEKTWTDLVVEWSPEGSYLATYHMQGIVLWGGDDFEKIGRFGHPGVNVISFSPKERYLVTSNGVDKQNDDEPHAIIFWDVRNGKRLRGFDKGDSSSWPAFKWSHDDKYVARKGDDRVLIYETPTLLKLNNKSLKIPGVQDVAWSPTQNIISYWVPEHGNTPAKVALVEIPSRKLIREKHLYNVEDVKMHWQSKGQFLCVKITRRKTKKSVVNNFEIFRMDQKNIPVEVLEMDDMVTAFSWQPNGNRFALIHGARTAPTKKVSFYALTPKKLKRLTTLEDRVCNALFWSPTGNYIVLAGLGDLNGSLEFLETRKWNRTTPMLQDHFQCNEVEWDPSGRFLITAVTQPLNPTEPWRFAMENGYKLWSCTGKELASVKLDGCYQVSWRPRPKTLLSPETVQEIKDQLKIKYWKKFEQEDEEIRQSQMTGAAKEKQQMKTDWKSYRQAKEREYKEESKARRELRSIDLLSDDEDNYVEITVEEEEEIEVTEVEI